MSPPEFSLFVEVVERDAAARRCLAPRSLADPVQPEDAFMTLTREALDALPTFVLSELANNVAVVVSDDGHKHGAYGLYVGGTAANSDYRHCILIFRDTLSRDFGHDPEELRRQISITVRHEVAHHLGADERRVSRLGL